MWWLLLAACTLYESSPGDTDDWVMGDEYCWAECECWWCENDVDEDQFCADDPTCDNYDCDDANPDVFPGQEEVCNGIDDNCVDGIDEGLPDADGDGTCDAMDEETCDGLDNDGDGLVDEEYSDLDDDGIADCVDQEECDGVDNDGDGEIDEGFDADGDGSPWCMDCDDTDAWIHPGAEEDAWGGVDEDCDGLVDETAWVWGDLVFTELLTDPARVSDTYGEWLEIRNAASRDVVLDGLVLTGRGERHVITSLSIPRSGRAVLAREDDANVNGRVPVDYEYTGIWLSEEDSISIQVEDPGAPILVIDTVSWYDLRLGPEYGASRSLDGETETAEASDDFAAWCLGVEPWGALTDLGSPGEPNPDC